MSDPSQWMDSSKLSLAVLLVRAGCFTDCNPGGLRQRLIRHGRDRAQNWQEEEGKKDMCTRGCDFAAHAEEFLSAQTKEKIFVSEKKFEEMQANIVEPSASAADRAFRIQWEGELRQHCHLKCASVYHANSEIQLCKTGCDAFFKRLA